MDGLEDVGFAPRAQTMSWWMEDEEGGREGSDLLRFSICRRALTKLAPRHGAPRVGKRCWSCTPGLSQLGSTQPLSPTVLQSQ